MNQSIKMPQNCNFNLRNVGWITRGDGFHAAFASRNAFFCEDMRMRCAFGKCNSGT